MELWILRSKLIWLRNWFMTHGRKEFLKYSVLQAKAVNELGLPKVVSYRQNQFIIYWDFIWENLFKKINKCLIQLLICRWSDPNPSPSFWNVSISLKKLGLTIYDISILQMWSYERFVNSRLKRGKKILQFTQKVLTLHCLTIFFIIVIIKHKSQIWVFSTRCFWNAVLTISRSLLWRSG